MENSHLVTRRKRLIESARQKVFKLLEEIHQEDQIDLLGDEAAQKLPDPLIAVTVTILDQKTENLDLDRLAMSATPKQTAQCLGATLGGYGGFTLVNRKKLHGPAMAAMLGSIAANVQVDNHARCDDLARQATGDNSMERKKVKCLMALRATISMLTCIGSSSTAFQDEDDDSGGRSIQMFRLEILAMARSMAARYVAIRDGHEGYEGHSLDAVPGLGSVGVGFSPDESTREPWQDGDGSLDHPDDFTDGYSDDDSNSF